MSVLEPLDALLGWFTREGGEASALAVVQLPGGERGLRTRRAVASGEALVRVPESLLLTPARARATPAGVAVVATVGDAPGPLLAVHLLAERAHGASRFAPYLAALPASFAHLPVMHDDSMLAPLSGSPTRARIEARRRMLASEARALAAALPELVEPAAYAHARLAVGTRLFSLRVDGQERYALAPVADLFNHRRSPDAVWAFDDRARCFVVSALNDLPAGADVHLRYGLRGNASLFLDYGFALPDNPDDEAPLALPCEPALAPAARASGGEPDGTRAWFHVPARARARQTAWLLCYARAAAGSRWRPPPGLEPGGAADEVALAPPDGLTRERAALRIIEQACAEGLAALAGDEIEDAAAIADPALAEPTRNAVLVRRGERGALRALEAFAREAGGLMQRPDVLVRRALAGRYARGERWDEYYRAAAGAAGPGALAARRR